jgi:uncharacterized protein with von Willebrand factor type A (vWA) domain
MFIDFFLELKETKVPVSVKEFLMLMEAMDQGLANYRVDEFYYLSRAALVKDERHLDRFDRAFAKTFDGIEFLSDAPEGIEANIPDEWLKKLTEKFLTDEEKAEIESLGGWEALMDTLKQRLQDQQGRHHGGSKWIGTGGTSPFGAYGYNPEGIRIGQQESRHRRAVKVWDKRDFRNLDDSVEIGTRNIKVALRRLRKFARQGAPELLDLPGTIRSTARNAGMLDIQMMAERRNTVKVLLLLDVGGSMDDFIKVCEELFSAARTEFKQLEYFYFHNFVYEGLWRDNRRLYTERTSTWDLIHTYGPDYKLIFVGDASMSPFEIMVPGGSVEHWNAEPGEVWVRRLLDTYRNAVWLNPVKENAWAYTPSIDMTRDLIGSRMYPLTLGGLDRAMRELN